MRQNPTMHRSPAYWIRGLYFLVSLGQQT
jgi:hypothetical protein